MIELSFHWLSLLSVLSLVSTLLFLVGSSFGEWWGRRQKEKEIFDAVRTKGKYDPGEGSVVLGGGLHIRITKVEFQGPIDSRTIPPNHFNCRHINLREELKDDSEKGEETNE